MKKNKKFYNFTDKQKRRDRSLDQIHFHTIGKPFKIIANRSFRRRNNRILQKNISEIEDIPFIRYRKYLWWDF
jgi:TATA-binding protein-associated factor Taf7